jgi:hypothetical protein
MHKKNLSKFFDPGALRIAQQFQLSTTLFVFRVFRVIAMGMPSPA